MDIHSDQVTLRILGRLNGTVGGAWCPLRGSPQRGGAAKGGTGAARPSGGNTARKESRETGGDPVRRQSALLPGNPSGSEGRLTLHSLVILYFVSVEEGPEDHRGVRATMTRGAGGDDKGPSQAKYLLPLWRSKLTTLCLQIGFSSLFTSLKKKKRRLPQPRTQR